MHKNLTAQNSPHVRHARLGFGVSGAVMALLIMLGQQGTSAATDCVGKPYGYPGCPAVSAGASSSSVAIPPHCGDGTMQESEGEQCDRGFRNGQTDCTTACKRLYCGDGIVSGEIQEECEPTSELIYVEDPVTGQLKVEEQFLAASCGTYCTAPDPVDNQGGCKWQYGPMCTSSASSTSAFVAPPLSMSSVPSSSALIASTGEPSLQSSGASSIAAASAASSPLSCGDGTRQGTEECDDGNTENADLCSNTCHLPVCGDGIVQTGEQCDDGNRTNLDSCTNLCKASTCGDGVLQDGEQCDDGNDNAIDSCTNSCKVPRCGDGFVQAGEQCDDGNASDFDLCLGNCRAPSCGDGVQEGLEECDDGNRNNTDGCSNTCRLGHCGDNVLQAGEECDDGMRNSDQTKDACRTSCRKASCGDGVVDRNEQCDGGAGCSAQCITVAVSTTKPVVSPGQGGGSVAIIIQGIVGASIIVLSILGYLFRGKLLSVLGIKKQAASIDDIPLNQIEMPWNKW